ncbi:uncharacterized protein LOC130674212 [Microplitis mediator]|uniref:uncharacterized protein LOC130668723 n=1 Tax=Microplitis mediator TaxID=375433 RepID=UPI0025558D58|nr:uncharacterized protein LOC130668723 [Microplitis mediator]XP_057329121.1 uncharacterized protein LOC130669965 [Microplitis mediator]XP_057335463.1 uncharacterized protein LOC130674212 [Microplitis mediator]
MAEILDIQKPIVYDESIAHYELHAHQPYASSTLNNNDEIRICVQNQGLCLLLNKSTLHITGKFTKSDGTAVNGTMELVNMAVCHMIEELSLLLNGVVIDQCKNVAITCLMKSYTSLSPGQRNLMENAGWLMGDANKLTNDDGYFDVSIPLSVMLGFAEDYNRIVMNATYELVIRRSNTDLNAYIHKPATVTDVAANVKITLNKVEWLIPHITISDKQKIQALNYISSDPAISMSFRSWELYEYPLLPATTKHIWQIKTSTQLEKPRYVILGFQTARKNAVKKDASQFDHCNLRDVKLFLNSQSYPYGNLNLDIDRNQYALLYDMYTNFQTSYYGKEPEPLLTKAAFLKEAPLYVIDCSKQNEAIKSGPVDVRVEFESKVPFSPQTSAYCLILHDRIIEYNPISNNVRKLM